MPLLRVLYALLAISQHQAAHGTQPASVTSVSPVALQVPGKVHSAFLLPHVELKNAKFGILYTDYVNSTKSIRYFFTGYLNESVAVRVYVSADNVTEAYPILFVVEQQREIMSWRLPLRLQSNLYSKSSRTLCRDYLDLTANSTIIIDVSSMVIDSTQFHLRATIISVDIETKLDNVVVSPPAPQYFHYTMPENLSSVIVKVESDDYVCARMSVQNDECPVDDMLSGVLLSGFCQTIRQKGAITVERRDFPKNASFFVVVAAEPNNEDCTKLEPLRAIYGEIQRKLLNISIIPSISDEEFIVTIIGTFSVFLLFYFVAFIISVIHCCRRRSSVEGMVTQSLLSPGEFRTSYGTSDTEHQHNSHSRGGVHFVAADDTSYEPDDLDQESADVLDDADDDKDVYRTRVYVTVADLSRKSSRTLTKRFHHYTWNLITLAIFYALPVIQLVLTYQTVINMTGDQDRCYYNFYCTHRFGVLTAFNNVFSNVGYIMLGLLFLCIVYRRNHRHKRQIESGNQMTLTCGIPQHFGLFYAMGIALVMEGVLSACYHVCPSNFSFQFDTSFMYMIGWLSMLKIYQTRHADVTTYAHTAYCIVAIVVFFGVIGMTKPGLVFWIIFTVIYITCSFLLSIYLYYMFRLKLDLGIFRRICLAVRRDRLRSCVPTYADRMVLIVIGLLMNWSIAGLGVTFRPYDFASFLLVIVIANLLMYFTYYIVMKLRSGEKILVEPLIYIVSGMALWGVALYFFMRHLTSWQESPALSRESNEDCLLFHFYDSHDIWHFLSAISLFIGYMLLLTLDDDLQEVPRCDIRSF